jgi:hypothetical protein
MVRVEMNEKPCQLWIHIDEYAEHPRKDYDTITTMATWMKNGQYGDIQHHEHGLDPKQYRKQHIPAWSYVENVYAYIHSGTALSTSPFSCPWDSGWMGFIYITPERAKRHGYNLRTKEGKEWAADIIKDALRVYEAYLNGQVYGVEVVDEEGDIVESCGPFYGDHDESGLRQRIIEELGFSEEIFDQAVKEA